MTWMLLVFITVLCFSLGMRVFLSETQAMVFTRRLLPLKNVKKYNKSCGILIMGFAVVADFIILGMTAAGELISSLIPLGIIVESAILLAVYARIEKKMIQEK